MIAYTLRFVAALLLLLVALAGCRGTTRVSGGTPPPETNELPVEAPLKGPIPVGRWSCLPADEEYAAMRESSSAQVLPCDLEWQALELKPGDDGWTLNVYERPE